MKTPYAVRRPVVNEYLEREHDLQRRRELVLVALALLPLVLGLFLYTWIQLETRVTGYRIGTLERELDALERRRRELELEAAMGRRPDVVEKRAAALGLEPQRLEQTIFYEEIR